MTQEKSPQNIEKVNRLEKLGKEYDLKIGDSKIDNLIGVLNEAKENSASIEIIETFESALIEAMSERLKILNILKNHQDKEFSFSTNQIILQKQLELTISKINSVLKKEETEKAEAVEEVMYETVGDRISDYLKELNGQISPEFIQHLDSFILDKKILAEQSDSKEAKDDLIALKNLYFKAHSGEKSPEQESIVIDEAEKVESKKELDENPKEEGNEDVAVDPSLYISVEADIETYSKILDNETKGEDDGKIQLFIDKNIKNILELLGTKKAKNNKKTSWYKKLKTDLKALRDLDLKLNNTAPEGSADEKPTAESNADKKKILKNLKDLNSSEINTANKKNEEPDAISDYDYVIKSIIDDEDPQARFDFLDKKTHRNVTDILVKEIEDKKINEAAENVIEFISKHQERINKLIGLVTKYGSEQGSLLLKKLKNDLNKLEALKSTPVEKEDSWLGFNPIDTRNPNDKDNYLPFVDERTMRTIPDLFTRFEEAIGDYNKLLVLHSPKETITESLKKIEEIKAEFKAYKESSQKPEDKSKSKKEFDSSSKKEEEKVKPEIKIFTMKEGEDYSEIGEDKGFDKWIANMDKSLRSEKTDLTSEVKDVKDWYKEYQETIPYIETLNTVFEYLKNNTRDDVELLAAQNKVDDLIYRIHKEGAVAKQAIHTIFESYEKSKEDKKNLEEYKKREELKEVLEKSKNKGGVSARKITSDQIKQVLESRGEENTVENLNELTNFLEDFQDNYKFYSSGTKEGQENSMRYAYNKYIATGRKHIEPKKINLLEKLKGRLIASLPKNIDDQDKYNHFISMTKTIRSFDLVDRLDGNKNKAQENKQKMSDLIDFCKNNADTLDKYLTNKSSVDIAAIEADPEKKKLFDTAVNLFKTYTQGKYRTPEARAKAEKILSGDLDFDESSVSEPTIEMLYSITPLEREMFETNAKLTINKKNLTKISSEIESLSKLKTEAERSELEKIQKRFETVKSVLEKIGGDSEKNELKTIELKLSVLRLKNINTKKLKELSDSFPTYEYILSSKEITIKEKTEYIGELVKELKKHRENKENTLVQNTQLDAIIEKYQKVLKSIK